MGVVFGEHVAFGVDIVGDDIVPKGISRLSTPVSGIEAVAAIHGIAKLEGPPKPARIVAIDISPDAVKTTTMNMRRALRAPPQLRKIVSTEAHISD